MNFISKYYADQAAKGFSAAIATLMLPKNIIEKQIRRRQKKRLGSVIDGFSRFEVPLLASYSRSGTNWLRYFIETITNRPTPGQFRCVAGTDYVIDRAHRAYPVLDKYKSVLLIVRDYKECLLRHNKDHWLATKNVKSFMENSRIRQPCWWYMENIRAFDRFQKPKLLIYYEDLMNSPETELVKIGNFLGFPEPSVSDFLNHIEEHFKKSVTAYTSTGHTSETTQNKDLEAHARALLTIEQQHEFDDYLLNKDSELAQTYLSRYHYKLKDNKS